MVAIPQDLPGSPEYLSKLRYAWRVCSVTSLGLILIGISGSTLNVALPTVVRHFHADAFSAGWVLLAFLLVNTATLVFFGQVADLLGRREIYLAGFVLFTAGSLLAGLSPGIWFLIAMRAVQAVGAAMILANGTVIITDAFLPTGSARAWASTSAPSRSPSSPVPPWAASSPRPPAGSGSSG